MHSRAEVPTSERVSSVVILAPDALLAALPATAVQIAHACEEAGFDAVVPSSWGDELIARECAVQLSAHGDGPAILCACPHVAARLATPDGDLDSFMLQLAASPVVTARYLRALARGVPLRITFVGACPAGSSPEIDERFTPESFLGWLGERGVSPANQPDVYDSVIPPDRRRFHSLPGGLPVANSLAHDGGRRSVVEIFGEDYASELAEQLIEGRRVLLDLAPRLGCACSGASEGVTPRTARMVMASLEPPRAGAPVVDHSVPVNLKRSPLPIIVTHSAPRAPEPAAPPAVDTHEPAENPGAQPTADPMPDARGEASRSCPVQPLPRPPRLTPVGATRLCTTGVPRTIDSSGRRLPRAYVASRRTPSSVAPVQETRDRIVLVPSGTDEAIIDAQAESNGQVSVSVTVTLPVSQDNYEYLVAGIEAVVADQVPAWRRRVGEAVEFWKSNGYVTTVLERALSLRHSPDVDGLLDTYAAAVSHLNALQELGSALDPSQAGAAAFRDPERVAEAEAIVARLASVSSR